ncbi:oxidoreductase [Pseudonocardia sulfidoxydans NBRC 16205]|uniref:Oxidoreductase n=1 Tax=Pseudonocardia sulfidoxydans NBRC 16205 TaxID=1223511 RepID=A0A511DIB4_9PSEU|nr:FAD-binding protein [Pseudonocardia sulfidoxydans]GEL24207.1 oxidoreductase [Pseudonocardia sulfidoxydans NBRC 16205]
MITDTLLGFQRAARHEPDRVLVATSADDIRSALAVDDLPVAVMSSGHGQGRVLDGGILISTHAFTGVTVDPARRTAWVEAGASWQNVVDVAAPHGLAPLSGSSPGVGAISYTLGGGTGLLARRHGFAADHVRRIDLVAMDGTPRTVTAESDPELFAVLRGGGAGLGVVTGMEIDLVNLTDILGGGLYLPAAPDVLDGWRRWTENVPEEMTSAAAMLVFPDLPMVPEPLRGRHVAQIQLAWCGDPATGADVIAPLRDLGTVLRDTVRGLPFTESATVFDEPDRPHAYRSANRLVSGLDPAALGELAGLAGPSAPVMTVVGIRHLGGALARPPAVPNVVGHRDAAYSVMVLSPLEAPGDAAVVEGLHSTALALVDDVTLGRSLNFSYGAMTPEQVRECWSPADADRIAAATAALDPAGRLLSHQPMPR